ncbi:hypothetical protein CFC21_004153 [Triticum aestivum]|uniref:Histone H4 n=1 Tax=Triticum aestivum TaxID=4565 RepID=A0A3B5Y6U0_WHEAT|nr:hypothetical protein CFC21_004153 [Triticum aestivum]
MSERGNIDTGLGKGGAERHWKVLFDKIQGITKPTIQRIAERGGLKHISVLIYLENHGVLKIFLEKVRRETITYTDHARSKTDTAMEVLYTLKHRGRTLYDFAD